MSEGVSWFDGLSTDDQSTVLHTLVEFCVQARATAADAPESILRSGIKPTHTSAVLLTTGQQNGFLTRGQLTKIARLPPNEGAEAFRLLVSLLGVADGRRRSTFCAGGCHHSWHQL